MLLPHTRKSASTFWTHPPCFSRFLSHRRPFTKVISPNFIATATNPNSKDSLLTKQNFCSTIITLIIKTVFQRAGVFVGTRYIVSVILEYLKLISLSRRPSRKHPPLSDKHAGIVGNFRRNRKYLNRPPPILRGK